MVVEFAYQKGLSLRQSNALNLFSRGCDAVLRSSMGFVALHS